MKNAKRYGGKLAIIDRTTGKKLTYTQTLIASLLLSEKCKHLDPGFVGLMVPTSAGGAVAALGILMSGRTPVMINYSTGAAANAEYAQNKCNFRTIITSKALLARINCPVVDGMIFLEDIMESITMAQKLKAALTSKLTLSMLMKKIHRGNEDDTLVVLFTTGSEKEPKAVPLTHKNISSNVGSLSEMFHLSEKEIMLANLPFFHVFGQSANLWLAFFHGMTMVTIANPLDYKGVCDGIREEHATIVAGTPTFFSGYLRKSEPGDFASIRIMFTAADKCPDSLRHAYLERHNITLYEAYGTTETSPGITSNCPGHNRPGSVGRTIPGVEVRIEHYESGEVCRAGETGKILVKGPNVMKGYFDDLEETSLHLRHGWYDTGDMGFMDGDGYLWHVGRLRRFVKIGGEMVSLVKVETALEALIPEDISCCIVEIPDAVKGSKIIAVVTGALDEKAVLKTMAKTLPNIALPKSFVVVEELPKMGSGKIDFRSVTELARTRLLHNEGIK